MTTLHRQANWKTMNPTVTQVTAIPPSSLQVVLSNGRTIRLDVAEYLTSPGYELLGDPEVFAGVAIEEWGHGIEWPIIDQGIPVETLVRLGREQAGAAYSTTEFNAWMERNRLSLNDAAKALGLTRRTIVYYHCGQKPIPRYIGLACEGWEARQQRKTA